MSFLYRHMKREGTITFNGSPSTKRLKRNIGFVMQVCFRAHLSVCCTPCCHVVQQSAACTLSVMAVRCLRLRMLEPWRHRA